MSNITVTVTDQTMTVVARGDFTQDEWQDVVYRHGLQDRSLDIIDFRIEDTDDEEPVMSWRFAFVDSPITVPGL